MKMSYKMHYLMSIYMKHLIPISWYFDNKANLCFKASYPSTSNKILLVNFPVPGQRSEHFLVAFYDKLSTAAGLFCRHSGPHLAKHK